jgi:hypothetical protein
MADKEKLIWLLCNAHSKSCEASAFDGISYAEQLSMEADFLLENGITFAKDTNVPSWIPVSERLPDNLETVLCYTNFQEVRLWQWNERWNSWIGLIADYGKNVVTHWMPLPEPPKEDK